MAERKKVQQIRPMKKSKSAKKTTSNRQKFVSRNTTPIEMSSAVAENNQKKYRTQSNLNSKKENYNRKTSKTTKKSHISQSANTTHSNAKRKNISDFSHHATQKTDFSVVKGNKVVLQKKRVVSLCISFIVVMSILIFCFTSPTGPIERITNAVALIGSNKSPITLSGTNVVNFKTANNKAFALTNSHLCGYTYSGKDFLQIQHSFSNPVLETSKERVLVYNRESNKFIIANNSNSLFEQSLEQTIFCADIADNGSVAFATDSPAYAAQIAVYNRNMKLYYTWYLADGLVTDVCLSKNGRYVAVSVLKVNNGLFVSEIYCLDTDEQEPIFTKELKDESVLSLESISSSCFAYISNKNISFLKWKSGDETGDSSEFLSPSYFDVKEDYVLATFSETNRTNVVMYNKSGKNKHQFVFNGKIDDISIFEEYLYILSGNQIHILDFSGNVKEILNLDSKPDYILGVKNGIFSINNININLITPNFNKE